MKARVPEDAFVLDEAEVDAIKYMPVDELEGAYRGRDESLVPANLDSEVRGRTPWRNLAQHHTQALVFQRSELAAPFCPSVHKASILMRGRASSWRRVPPRIHIHTHACNTVHARARAREQHGSR